MLETRPWDPLLRSIDAPLRGTFHPLGFPLEIETNDRRILECAESSFGIFPKAESGAEPLRMRLVRAPEASAAAPWPAPAYRAWGDLFAVVCGPDNFLTADLARCEAMGFFSPAMLDDREFFRWTFLDCATYVLLVRHHFTTVHAACVVRDGHGICLCGAAGVGKTSLAFACVRAGYRLLADDVVYLLRSEKGLQLHGNPSRLHFPVSARELFPELKNLPIAIRRDGNEFLAVRTVEWLSDSAVTQAEAGAVVFLEHGAKEELENVQQAEAHRLLFEALPLDNDETMAAHRRSLERLVRVGAYRLRFSTLEQARRYLDSLSLPQRIWK